MALGRAEVQLGPVAVPFFGLIVGAALALAGLVAVQRAQRRGEDAGIVLDLIIWGLAAGVVAGRLFYILAPPPSVAAFYDRRWFLAHPFDLQVGALAVWSGGLSRAGLLVGALLAGVFVLWRRGQSLYAWADVLAPALLLMLAILPWANLANGQLLGPPTTLPWGIALGPSGSLPGDLPAYSRGTRFHPTPAYLSVWALLVLIAVLAAQRRWSGHMQDGGLSLLAAGLYLPGLLLFDFLRMDVSRPLLGLTGLQAVAVLLLGGVVALGFGRLRRAGGPQVEPPRDGVASTPTASQ